MLNSFKSQVVEAHAQTYSTDNRNDMTSLFGINSSAVSISNAQKIATVMACINIKANALAVIPIKTYLRSEKGKEEARNTPLYNLLRYEPNPDLTASMYKKMISQDIDLRGNHYSQIVRNRLGEVKYLYPLMADKMQVTIDSKGKKQYQYNGVIVSADKILHIWDIPNEDGTGGISRIQYAKETLEYANSTSQYGNQLFKNGATPTGVFENQTELTDEAFNRLKEQLDKNYQGLKNTGKPMLLEGGLTYKALSITNSDSEWLESRKFNREEIGNVFGVPVAMLNDPTNTAYGNLEQKYLEFYTGTIYPLTTLIEESMRMKLLNGLEKNEVSIKFKFNALLRADAKTRAEYYQARFNIGSITPNEIRAYEDENPIANGDEAYVQLNLSTLENINHQEKGVM